MKYLSLISLSLLTSITLSAATDDWAQHNRYATANQAVEKAPAVVFIGSELSR